MNHLKRFGRKNLGQILVSEGMISKEHLHEAEQEQTRTGEPVGVILVDAGYLDDRDLARTVADSFQLPFMELANISPNFEMEDLMPRSELVRHRVVPIDRLGKILILAIAAMPEYDFLQSVQRKTGLVPYLFVTTLTAVRQKYAEDLKDGNFGMATGVEVEVELVGDPDGASEWRLDGSHKDGEDWKEVFDMGNESVLKEMDQE